MPVTRINRLIRRFASDQDGAIAIMFGIAVIPVLGLIGFSIDYAKASAVRSQMQAAMDSTALMLAKSAGSMTADELQAKATSYFNAVFNQPGASGSVRAVYSSGDGGSSLALTGTASVPTAFMGALGRSSFGNATESVVKWGNTRLRLSLVLDVTGSMASAGKMEAMKTAAKNMVAQLKAAATRDGDVYISIVPFAKDVNIGANNRTQSWINWTLWDAANGTCSRRPDRNTSKSRCVDDGGSWTPDSHDTWNGCITDRDQDYDTRNTPPSTATPATLFPAEQYSTCPAAIMGLTYNWTDLTNKIDALRPNGGTNQSIGLQWGFQSLTSSPFTVPAKDPNYFYNEVIILLSDGLNTQNRWYGNGTTHDSRIDARQAILCNNVKNAGIVVYTVQVSTEGDPLSAVLQQCASGSDKFFFLTSASQMVDTFKQIGTSLAQLRLAR